MAAWKILPAIAAGNTIVLKPAEITPLTSLMFAEACHRGGHPGRRGQRRHRHRARSRASAWSAHPDVAMVSFTGSTAGRPAGRRDSPPRPSSGVHLELGGKAPVRRLRRRRPGGRRPRRGRRRADQHRPGLHRRHPRLRAAPALRRLRRRRSPNCSPASGSATRCDPATDLGPAGLAPRSATGWPASSSGPAATAPRSSSAARSPDGGDLARRRLLPADPGRPAAPRTARSSRTRSSARCWWCCPSTPTTRACGWPTTPRTAWPPRPGPGTCSARCGPPGRSGPAACGSTTTSRSSARCRTAATRPVRLRQGHVARTRFEEYTQVKHVMYDITGGGPQGLAPHDLRPLDRTPCRSPVGMPVDRIRHKKGGRTR